MEPDCQQYEPYELEWQEHLARQAAGLEPPDNYRMTKEIMPPPIDGEVERVAEKLCRLLEESASLSDEWRRLGKQIRATILGDGRPAHRPPSADIAARDVRIREQVEYWKKAQPKRPQKAIYHDVGRPYGLSARTVKEIVANVPATQGHLSPS
jgi:hypothetical protein